MSNSTALVQGLWNYYTVLRDDDGVSYGDKNPVTELCEGLVV